MIKKDDIMNTQTTTHQKQLQIDVAVAYETFEKNPNVPKSKKEFIQNIFKSIWLGLKKGFPKNLIVALCIGLAYWLFNIFFLAYINDTCFFNENTSYLAYIFGGKAKNVKGIPNDTLTWYYSFTFMFTLIFLIKSVIRRMLEKGFLAPFKDIFRIKPSYNAYMNATQYEAAKLIFIPMAISFILSYLIVNPFTILLLSIIMFLSFAKGMESAFISIIFAFRVSKNLGKNPIDRRSVLDGDIALPLFGLAAGFLFYSFLIIIMWFLFKYSFLVRTMVSLVFLILFLVLGMKNTMSNKSVKNTVNILLFSAFSLLSYKTASADDGGWSESGRSLAGFLANPGAAIMALAGLGGQIGAAFGYIVDTVVGGALEYVAAGSTAVLSMVAGGLSTVREMTHGAINTAFNAVPGLGDTIGELLGKIERGFNGGVTGKGPWNKPHSGAGKEPSLDDFIKAGNPEDFNPFE